MPPKRYSDPYLAGIGIGLALLAAYVFAGRGLGASGAFSSVAAAVAGSKNSPATAPYLDHPVLQDWLVWELLGVMAGGFLSARIAGRATITVEHGSAVNTSQRIGTAILGGLLMGFGAKFARGCTSGQGLTGGALLSAGSWIFIITCFAAGYLFSPVARRLWR